MKKVQILAKKLVKHELESRILALGFFLKKSMNIWRKINLKKYEYWQK